MVSKGDIVLVKFPFSDLNETKPRPIEILDLRGFQNLGGLGECSRTDDPRIKLTKTGGEKSSG
jgi:hypothetical protein